MKELALMFSGGTDSTAAVVMIANQFERIHLVTCTHSGIDNIENSKTNIPALQKKFGEEKFKHVILDMDGLFKLVSYDRYIRNVFRYGFLNLTSCGTCKLAMHLRTLMYCIDNDIHYVADGANHNSSHFPAQMIGVIEEIRNLYKRFDIDFVNPVFELGFPKNIDWFHKTGLAGLASKPENNGESSGLTTGQVIREAGIVEAENVKGTETDRKMQGLCFQLTLLNVFALSYYIPKHGMEKYKEIVLDFYQDKIARFGNFAQEYVDKREASTLYRAIR